MFADLGLEFADLGFHVRMIEVEQKTRVLF